MNKAPDNKRKVLDYWKIQGYNLKNCAVLKAGI